MLSTLIDRYIYHEKNQELISHEKHGVDWFYFTVDKCEERTAMSKKEQETAIKILKQKGFIRSVVFGLPGKRHFRLNEEKILEAFNLSKNISRSPESGQVQSNKVDKHKATKSPRIYKNPIKNPKEEPYKTTTTTSSDSVVVDVFQKQEDKEISNENAINEAALAVHQFLSKRSNLWGNQWNISIQYIKKLMQIYGIDFVNQQIHYMLNQQTLAVREENSNKSKKTKPIDKPEIYLRLSCERNYALADKGKI